MRVRLSPAHLSGTVRAVASKSAAHRALLAAALADGPTALLGLPERRDCPDDLLATVGCIEALGGAVRMSGDAWRVSPCRPRGAVTLDCIESGTTLRFLLPVAAAIHDRTAFFGRGRLPERPIGALLSALAAHGCTVRASERPNALPLTVSGFLQAGEIQIAGDVSSQFLSGLLLAAPVLSGPTRLIVTGTPVSAGYADLTVDVMRAFGASVRKTGDGYAVLNTGYRSPGTFAVEGDWSSAAVFLAARALGHEVSVTGLSASSLQPDRCVETLCTRIGGGAHLDVSGCPDLVPVLAVVAAMAEGETHIERAAHLRYKESDRLAALAEGLTALGVSVAEREDGLSIRGGDLHGGTVGGCGDHRMVMAWALAALGAKEPLTVLGAEAVAKSYPRFFEVYQSIGGRVDVLGLEG